MGRAAEAGLPRPLSQSATSPGLGGGEPNSAPPRQPRGAPLYQQVKHALERQILSGQLRAGDFLPPEPELCRQFAVSTITMRRALMELGRDGLIRRKGGVGTVVAATRRKLRFALLFLGFDEQDWTDRGELFGNLLAGIGDAAWRANADFSTVRTSAREDPTPIFKNLLDERQVDGVLLRTAGDVPPGAVDLLESRGMPYVAIKRHIEGRPMNFVTVDDRAALRRATEHLIELGHTRIALMMAAPDISPRRELLAGYREALGAHGLALDPRLEQTMARRGLPTQEAGFAAMRALLALENPPTAACIDGGEMVIGAFDALAASHLRVPDDIAIVGHGDMRVALGLRPALTMIETPYAEIGRIAAMTLFDLIASPGGGPRQVMLHPPLVVRASCGVRRTREPAGSQLDSQRTVQYRRARQRRSRRPASDPQAVFQEEANV